MQELNEDIEGATYDEKLVDLNINNLSPDRGFLARIQSS
jgi:hypothetical protein